VLRPGCIDEDTLADLFARGASASSRDAVERHVDTCIDCRELVAAFARATDDSAIDDDMSSAPTMAGAASAAFAATMSSDVPPPPPGGTATAAEIGQLLAQRYLLDHIVGEGGMGVVWAARDLVGNRMVALKMLKDGSPELARRSWREAKAAAHVGHPSLVEVIDVLPPRAEGEAPILVMPLLMGESLDRVIQRRSTLGQRETLEILEPVIAGMHAAHARGVIHRDLKPPNVFLATHEDGTTDGANGGGGGGGGTAGAAAPTVLVLDFGLAKILSDDGTDEGADKLTRTGALLGTPWYMAPEQLFGDSSVDHRADVWAIGVMIYECISGRRPVEGRSYGQIARNVARGTIAPLGDGVHPALAALTSRMLDKDREARPNLGEVHATVRSLLDPP
jgi:serine/threonine protein kinase